MMIPEFQGLKVAGRLKKGGEHMNFLDSSSISLLDGYLRSDVDVVKRAKNQEEPIIIE